MFTSAEQTAWSLAHEIVSSNDSHTLTAIIAQLLQRRDELEQELQDLNKGEQ